MGLLNKLGLIQVIGSKHLRHFMDKSRLQDSRLSERDSKLVRMMGIFHIGRVKMQLKPDIIPMMRPMDDDRIELSFEINGYHVIITTPQESTPNSLKHTLSFDPSNPDSIRPKDNL